MNDPKLIDCRFVSHMLLRGGGHRLDAATVDWPGNPIDGKTVLIATDTKRNAASQKWGRGEMTFYLEGKGTPEFETLEKLFDHYRDDNKESIQSPV